VLFKVKCTSFPVESKLSLYLTTPCFEKAPWSMVKSKRIKWKVASQKSKFHIVFPLLSHSWTWTPILYFFPVFFFSAFSVVWLQRNPIPSQKFFYKCFGKKARKPTKHNVKKNKLFFSKANSTFRRKKLPSTESALIYKCRL